MKLKQEYFTVKKNSIFLEDVDINNILISNKSNIFWSEKV